MAVKTHPRIPNVYWRNGIAWARAEKNGKERRKSLETEDPKVARERVQKFLDELTATNWGEKPKRTYDEAASRFIDEHLPRLKPRGAHRYLQSLQILTPHFEGKFLEDITSASLSDFENARRKDGVTSGTIRNDLWCLSSIITCANEWEWAIGNPVSAYIRSRAKRGLLAPSPPRTRYCSIEEEDELLARCKGRLSSKQQDEPRDHIMLAAGIALTIDIGLRKEELLAADWTMVDLDRNEWTVPAHLSKTGRKTGRGRTIPIMPRSQDVLRNLPRSPQTPSVLWFEDRRKDGRVIHKRYSDLLRQLMNIASGGRSRTIHLELQRLVHKGIELTDEVRSKVAKLANERAWATDISDLIWHDLRRTCGCRLLQVHGASIEHVSKWLGHASIDQTQKSYAFLEIEHLHDAVGTRPAVGEVKVAGLIEHRARV